MNVRSVLQGEFCVSKDPDTVLITVGMTECVGVCFVNDQNPAHRLVCHMDGFTLCNPEIATNNIKILIEAFEKMLDDKINTFRIFALGGNDSSSNIPNLKLALKAHGKEIYKLETSKQFCERFNSANSATKFFRPINPTNAFITLVSDAKEPEPNFASYKPDLTPANTSSNQLENGGGVINSAERDKCARFKKANEELLRKSSFTDVIVTTVRQLSQLDDIIIYLEKIDQDSKATPVSFSKKNE